MESVAAYWNALTPEELVARYTSGERKFVGVNLLRVEIEHILEARPSRKGYSTIDYSEHLSLEPAVDHDDDDHDYWINPSPPLWFHRKFDTEVNRLWADCRDFDPEFEWFGTKHFSDETYDEIPTKLLTGIDLREIILTGAYLYPVDLSNSILRGADLRKAKLIEVDLRGADMSYADLRRSTFDGCDLRDANLYMARLDRAVFRECRMEQVNLMRAKLHKTAITYSDLRAANLEYAHFSEATLNGSNLEGIELGNVWLPSCTVEKVMIHQSQTADFLRALEIRINGG